MLFEEIENAVDELLALPDPPDAILCASDRLTMGCYSLLHKKGVKIPEQIAIAGFSNFNSPELFCPSLTTIRQPAFDMGKTATELLIQLIESKRPPTQFTKKIFPTELFIRDSTRK
jgi:LacI family transcriptional regulator